MRIKHVEFKNFRKLFSVRLDLSAQTTLLVGANNSGKTSAMIALRHFLVDPSHFCMNDLTLSHWPKVLANGESWRNSESKAPAAGQVDWVEVAPTLDLWLDVAEDELHYVSKLIPTLDWTGGLLGVRLQYEPVDIENFRKEFVTALTQVANAKAQIPVGDDGEPTVSVKLWPENMVEFLERKLRSHFGIRAYILDPAKLAEPVNGQAKPQSLDPEQLPVELDNLRNLMRIDEIDAQRGFGQVSETDEGEGDREVVAGSPHN